MVDTELARAIQEDFMNFKSHSDIKIIRKDRMEIKRL